MPSLLDKLRGSAQTTLRSTTGQLTTSNRNELNQLAQARGRAAAPTSPLAAQLMGAGEHSTKMAGSKAQKASALSLGSSPSESLLDAQRRSQGRSGATQQEQVLYEKSEALQQAGAIGDSVHNLVSKYLPQQAVATESQTYQAVGGTDLAPDIQSQLDLFAQNPTLESATALAPQLEALGLVGDAANPFNYVETVDGGQFLADQLGDADQITLGNLYENADLESAIGLNDQDLAELIGIDPGQVPELTVSDLQKEIKRVQDEEFSRIEDLRSIATSRDSSVSEREQARQLLRDSGASGLVATEADVDSLVQSLDSAEEIQFGDSVYTAEDFLGDENISQLVGEYLNAEDADKAAFAERYGSDFVNFVESNSAILSDAATELDSTVESVTEIQDYNQSLQNVENLGTINSEVLDVLVPGWSSFQGERLEEPSVLQVLKLPSLSDDQRSNLYNTINDASPQIAERLRDLSLEELNELGALENSDRFQGTIAGWQLSDALTGLDATDPDQAAQIRNLLTSQIGGEDLERYLALNTVLETDDSYAGIIDRDRDGQIDDAVTLQENALQHIQSTGDGRLPTSLDIEYSEEDQAVIDEFGTYLEDGQFTPEEITQYLSEETSEPQSIVELIGRSPLLQSQIDPSVASELSSEYIQDFYTNEAANAQRIIEGDYWDIGNGAVESALRSLETLVEENPWLDSPEIQAELEGLEQVAIESSVRLKEEQRAIKEVPNTTALDALNTLISEGLSGIGSSRSGGVASLGRRYINSSTAEHNIERFYNDYLRESGGFDSARDAERAPSLQEVITQKYRENGWDYSDFLDWANSGAKL